MFFADVSISAAMYHAFRSILGQLISAIRTELANLHTHQSAPTDESRSELPVPTPALHSHQGTTTSGVCCRLVRKGIQMEFLCSDDNGLTLQISWSAPCAACAFEADGRELGPVGYAVHHDFTSGNGPRATRFQVRLRMASKSAGPQGDWTELAPQLVPTRTQLKTPRRVPSCCASEATLSPHFHLLADVTAARRYSWQFMWTFSGLLFCSVCIGCLASLLSCFDWGCLGLVVWLSVDGCLTFLCWSMSCWFVVRRCHVTCG